MNIGKTYSEKTRKSLPKVTTIQILKKDVILFVFSINIGTNLQIKIAKNYDKLSPPPGVYI
jgi:hypothetical protein